MASDYRQARAIRLFVGAMRQRLRDGDGTLARDGFEDSCHWALTDNLDPANNDRRCDGQGFEDAQVRQGRPTPPGRRIPCMFQAIRPHHDYATAQVLKDDDPVRVTTG
jgi:hypothetical protein